MLDIKLSVAEDSETGNLIHVSERMSSRPTLRCPYCKHPVIRKAGSVRRHHFAHQGGSVCNMSSETLLHEGAKVYVYHQLEANRTFDITVNIAMLRNSATKSMLSNLNISRVTVKSSSIFCRPSQYNVLEKALQSIRPDIISYDNRNEDNPLAWEIYVTHEVEPDKEEYFISNNIPFIELIPSESGHNSYSFLLNNYNGISIMDYDKEFMHSLYESNKVDMFSSFKELIETDYIAEQIDIGTSALRDNILKSKTDELINKNSIDLTKYNEPMSLYLSTSFSHDFITSLSDEGTWDKVEDIKKVKSDYGFSVMINGTYLDLPMQMLSRIYIQLYESGMCRAVINDNSQCIGVKLNIPSLRELKYRDELITLSNESVYKDDVDIRETEDNWSKSGKPYMRIIDKSDEYHVKYHDTQLLNIIEYFRKHYRVKALINTNLAGKRRVFGIKVIGLPDEVELKFKLQRIVDKCVSSVIQQSVSSCIGNTSFT